MELFEQINIVFPEDKNNLIPAINISDNGNLGLIRCIDVDTDYDLFRITIVRTYNYNLPNIKSEHKLHIYYVFNNSNHVYYNFVGKFIGSYISYEELPEKCKISIAPRVESEIQKKDILEVNKDNFRRAVNATYQSCFILRKRNDLILVEPRDIEEVSNCDFVFQYNKANIGLNSFLFHHILFLDVRQIGNLENILDINFRNAIFSKNLGNTTKKFYLDFVSKFCIPVSTVEYIRSNHNYENKYKYRFFRKEGYNPLLSFYL